MNNYVVSLNRIAVLMLGFCILFIFSGQTTKDANKSSAPIPESFSRHLDSLRKADNLEEWLASSIDYLGDKPVERIFILYEAESAAWRQPQNDDERLAWFDLLTNQGYYELYRGNIVRSIDAYEKAYRYYFEKPISGAEADVLEYVLKPLGNNYTRLGDYDRAFFIQEKSLAIALHLNDSTQLASIYHNLAASARWKGQLDSAGVYCTKGLSFVHDKMPQSGLLLSAHAEIFLLQKKIKEAESTIREAIKILQQQLPHDTIDVPNWLRGACQGYGEILREKKEWSTALSYYEKAEAIADKYFSGERKREKAKLSVFSGHLLLQMMQPVQALEKFNRALTLLIPSFQLSTAEDLPAAGELYAENTILDALNGKASCLRAMNKKEKALDCYMLMFAAERKLRFEFFSQAAKQQQQKENRQWTESAMETAYELLPSENSIKRQFTKKMLLIAEFSKAQLLLDEMITNFHYSRLKSSDSLLNRQFQIMQAITLAEKESLLNTENSDAATDLKKEMLYELSLIQKEVKEKYRVLNGYMKDDNLQTVDDLLEKIPDSTTVMEFFVGENFFYTLTINNNAITHIRRNEGAKAIQKWIKDFVFNWLQQGPQKMMNAPEEYYNEAYGLYDYLFTPDHLSVLNKQLLIIPDGIIGYLPFDALITDSTYRADMNAWPFLAKEKNIYFGYSLQTLQQQQTNNPDKTFAGFFISFDSSANASIPAVKKEYSSLQKTVKGNFFIEEDASLKSFQSQLEKVNLLHISTHSFLQGEENIPTLQLADDKFFLFELYGKSFQPQLVVLSACRTGHGMLAEGEGIISLARGFTASGAGGIMAGMWNMHDESTAELMQSFYNELKKDNHPSAALHAAKLQWLKQEHPQSFMKLPYYWAGIIYAGNNQPVNLAVKSFEINKILIAAAAVLVVLLIFLFLKKWKIKSG